MQFQIAIAVSYSTNETYLFYLKNFWKFILLDVFIDVKYMNILFASVLLEWKMSLCNICYSDSG